MNNNFRSEILNFISTGGIKLHYPEITSTTVTHEGSSTEHRIRISIGGEQVITGFFIKHILTHSLLDAALDSENPEIENKSFMEKYNSLPSGTSFESATKETYRILTLIRNVITHNKSKLEESENGIKFSYKQHQKNNMLTIRISWKCLAILYAIAVIRSKLNPPADRYHQLIISAMYASAFPGVYEFSDVQHSKSGIPLQQVTLDRGIKWRRRYRVTNTVLNFSPTDNMVKITNRHRIHPEESWAGDEYLVFLDEQHYLVPGEFLDENGEICKSELVSWRRLNEVI